MRTLLTIARFEMKEIQRSWIFRIIAGLGTIWLTIFSSVLFSTVSPVPYSIRSITGFIPYNALVFVNLTQSVIIAIVASDIFKRDKKFDTLEVIYIRSMSNMTYFLGKALGIFFTFFLLDMFILLIMIIINAGFSKLPFDIIPYITIYVTMVIPTIVFVIGLSFILMQLVRVQAVVVLLVIGYMISTMVFITNRWFYLPDFLSFYLPMVYSDFVGIPDMDLIIQQRAIYLLLGIAFILLSVSFFKRLPQSTILHYGAPLGAALTLLLATWGAVNYFSHHTNNIELRQEFNALNKLHSGKAVADAQNYEIDLTHQGNTISVDASVQLANVRNTPIESLIFSLNPGLAMEKVQVDGEQADFSREHHLLTIPLAETLVTGDSVSVQFSYSGSIDEAACYTDIPDSTLERIFMIWLYRSAKKYAWIEDDFVLLTPEALWYPRPGLPEGADFPIQHRVMFSDYQLTVSTRPELTPVSQGKVDTLENDKYRFTSDYPLPRISLAIGDYVRESTTVDSISYSLYRLKNHDYYLPYFEEITDTMSTLIREVREDIERNMGTDYPYNRFSAIEVPAQFYAYPRIWRVGTERVQPEQVYLPENGGLLANANFDMIDRRERWRQNRNNQTLTEKDKQIRRFKQFALGAFSDQQRGYVRRSAEESSYEPDCNIFPHFYTYTNFVDAPEWPYLNTALEGYLFRRNREEPEIPWWRRGMLTSTEEISRLLSKSSMEEVLASPATQELKSDMIRRRGEYFFKYIKHKNGIENLEEQLYTLVENSRFTPINADFLDALIGKEPLETIEAPQIQDIQSPDSSTWQTWYANEELPRFKFLDIEMYKIKVRDRNKYQVLLKVENHSTVSGVFEVAFQTRDSRGGRRRGGRGRQKAEVEKVVYMGPLQGKEVGLILDKEPRSIEINTLISGNLPVTHTRRFFKTETRKRRPAITSETVYPISLRDISEEIVVDNVDPGFEMENPPYSSWLKEVVIGEMEPDEQEFRRFNFWNTPNQWSMIKNASLYGDYIHSAQYIKTGGANKMATWRVKIPEAGSYDVYIYVVDKASIMPRWARNREWGKFRYNVHHDDGNEIIDISSDSAEEGWNYLGTFYFSAGEAKVELVDNDDAQLMIADAVRFVRQ